MRMVKSTLAFILPLVTILLNGCNPDEQQPAYVEVRNVRVMSDYTLQGTSSANITDVWVYVDNEYLGTFELPARIPVLKSGKQTMLFGAGIEANGIASTNEAYPLYRYFQAEPVLVPGETTVFDTLDIAYFPQLQYVYYEDFEKDTSGGGISLDTTTASLATIYADSSVVFEGKRSVKLRVTSSEFIVECTSVGDGYQLTPGRDTYLEMNYKCNQKFSVGLVGVTFNGERRIPVITLNPKNDWNKIYIRLGPYINANADAAKFKILIRMEIEAGSSEGVAYIDNLKLIGN